MSDSLPYNGDNAAEARRYALDYDKMINTAQTHQVRDIPANPAVVRASLQFTNDRWQCGRDDRLTEHRAQISTGPENYVERGMDTHLVQRGQEGAEHEGGKYDGEVVLGQDMGLAVFPSGARFCFLFPCMSGRGEGGLG